DLLASYGRPVRSELHGVQNQSGQLPAGHVDQGNTQVTLRALSRITSPQELANVGLATRNGQPVRVGDVARIEDGAAEPVTTANVNGTPAVLLSIQKQSGTTPSTSCTPSRSACGRSSPSSPPATPSGSCATSPCSWKPPPTPCRNTWSSAPSWPRWWCWSSCGTGAPRSSPLWRSRR